MIRVENIRKKYRTGSQDIHVLNGVNLEIRENEFAAIMGKSGSGKSTLLHVLGCLDHPDEGIYYFDGRDMLSASDDERAKVRSETIGFVFQSFNLIPELTIIENVSLPFNYRNDSRKKVDFLVRQAIEQVGLSSRLNH
ncbi:MAG: ABC transporter ATP-binding protein, partial [Desulfobulbaceae bacterium]|nr:ABC transporter ATP-binding protein [Desulfobulbaceae bacterium]